MREIDSPEFQGILELALKLFYFFLGVGLHLGG